MLLMLLIGWTILLPAFVVAGLYVGSGVLGRRRRPAAPSYDDLLTVGRFSEAAIELELFEMTPEAITGTTASGPSVGPSHSAQPSPAAPEPRPVGAGY